MKGNHTDFSKMDQTPYVAPESPRLPYHSHVQQLPCYHLNYRTYLNLFINLTADCVKSIHDILYMYNYQFH